MKGLKIVVLRLQLILASITEKNDCAVLKETLLNYTLSDSTERSFQILLAVNLRFSPPSTYTHTYTHTPAHIYLKLPLAHTFSFLIQQCKRDPVTGEIQDTLTKLAQQQTHGSKSAKVSEIVDKKDPAVFTAIQEGLDRANEDISSQAQRVGRPCNASFKRSH